MKIYLKLVKVLKFSVDTYVLGEGKYEGKFKIRAKKPKNITKHHCLTAVCKCQFIQFFLFDHVEIVQLYMDLHRINKIWNLLLEAPSVLNVTKASLPGAALVES